MGIGFLTPASYAAAVAVGALLVLAVSRRVPRFRDQSADALAAGMVAGEALMGLALAARVVFR
jgi:uncharacterized oligopeptide transporter (OPT) family protein